MQPTRMHACFVTLCIHLSSCEFYMHMCPCMFYTCCPPQERYTYGIGFKHTRQTIHTGRFYQFYVERIKQARPQRDVLKYTSTTCYVRYVYAIYTWRTSFYFA